MCVFFFNDTATTEIYTLSLHDALPIWLVVPFRYRPRTVWQIARAPVWALEMLRKGQPRMENMRKYVGENASVADRKSTRLNSSHANISYAVFCLKKKNKTYLKLTTCSN